MKFNGQVSKLSKLNSHANAPKLLPGPEMASLLMWKVAVEVKTKHQAHSTHSHNSAAIFLLLSSLLLSLQQKALQKILSPRL